MPLKKFKLHNLFIVWSLPDHINICSKTIALDDDFNIISLRTKWFLSFIKLYDWSTYRPKIVFYLQKMGQMTKDTFDPLTWNEPFSFIRAYPMKSHCTLFLPKCCKKTERRKANRFQALRTHHLFYFKYF